METKIVFIQFTISEFILILSNEYYTLCLPRWFSFSTSDSYLQAEIPWWGRGSFCPGNCRTFSPPIGYLPPPGCPAQHGYDQPNKHICNNPYGVTDVQQVGKQDLMCISSCYLFLFKHVSFPEDLHGIDMTSVFLLHQTNLEVNSWTCNSTWQSIRGGNNQNKKRWKLY